MNLLPENLDPKVLQNAKFIGGWYSVITSFFGVLVLMALLTWAAPNGFDSLRHGKLPADWANLLFAIVAVFVSSWYFGTRAGRDILRYTRIDWVIGFFCHLQVLFVGALAMVISYYAEAIYSGATISQLLLSGIWMLVLLLLFVLPGLPFVFLFGVVYGKLLQHHLQSLDLEEIRHFDADEF